MYSMSTASFTGEVNKVANVAAHAVVNVTLAVAQGNNEPPRVSWRVFYL